MKEDITGKLRRLKHLETMEFLEMGRLLEEAEKCQPWGDMGLTKGQWLAGEVGIPCLTATMARDAYFYFKEFKDFEGLTVGKIKLILPKLKAGDDVGNLLDKARSMLYTDLRDELHEKKNTENCQHKWAKIVKESWECIKCGRRIYTDPDKKL